LAATGLLVVESAQAQSWNQLVKVVAANRAADDQFGYSVAISGDYAIVGAIYEDHDASEGNFLNNSGSAYIFIILLLPLLGTAVLGAMAVLPHLRMLS